MRRTKPRLVGDNVARHQGDGAREPLRALMDGQERSKPVPGTVLHTQSDAVPRPFEKLAYPVVQPVPPKGLPRQNVKLMARGAFWEDRTVDRDLP